MLIGAAIASLAFGGVVYYFARSGRLSIRRDAAPTTRIPSEPSTHLLVLDPLLVNLAGEGAYLRLSVSLQVADTPAKKESGTKNDKSGDEAIAAVRDTALTVLGRQTADGLLALDGKEHLKVELKKALAEHNADLKVTKIFFTEFLVQR
ncbi:flagellar basal body-associated FliL family protein [Edaphobacter paludis]|uniref:Flagellar protein FliL n=1 Tax=Edaphobacter paludis TaxID=3035702 RepID=A0AAU7D4A6_9BACT